MTYKRKFLIEIVELIPFEFSRNKKQKKQVEVIKNKTGSTEFVFLLKIDLHFTN